MAEKVEKDIGKIFAEGTLIDEAVRKAVREAVLMHKRAGNSIVVRKGDQMVLLAPEEIEI
jgi:hypothetical protein